MSEFLPHRPTETCPIIHSFGNPSITTTYRAGVVSSVVTFECSRCFINMRSEISTATSQIANGEDKFAFNYIVNVFRGMYPPEGKEALVKFHDYIGTVKRTVPKTYKEVYAIYEAEINDVMERYKVEVPPTAVRRPRTAFRRRPL